jgi:hypothetical protein
MTGKTVVTLIIGSMIVGSMIEPVMAGRGKGGGGGGSTPVLTQVEIDDLYFMREEEKLARDVYIALYEQWGNRVFYNISLSEQKHTDAVLGLIVKYGLEDPASTESGIFNDPYLQQLYDDLIGMGMAGELEALQIGVLIEVTDITDIEECMTHTDKADILNVYGNLLAGSENHLDAFLRNVEAY